MKLTATLEAIGSKMDRNGNRYWAFRFTDHETGKEACGTVSGGESNVHQIVYGWSGKDWDRSIRYLVTDLPIREYNRLVKGWQYAGCTGDELQKFVRAELAK